MTQGSKLSALVICQNENRRIGRCLDSLAFCDEVIVVDGGSSDGTIEIVRAHDVTLIERPYIGTNDQKEFARQQASSEWVLNIDADEWVPDDLADEIRVVLTSPYANGFRIPVRSYLGGEWLRHGGWWPNRRKRLFRRAAGYWNVQFEPHDRVELDGSWRRLTHPIEHDVADSLAQLERKALRYGAVAGANLREQNTPTPATAGLMHPLWRFFRSYILQHGFLDGSRGVSLARIQALEAKTKYSILRGKNSETELLEKANL